MCLLAVSMAHPVWGSAQTQSEFRVKAAYVFNLTKYVEWPSEKESLTIGVIGEGPIVQTLNSELSGRISDSRLIKVLINPPDDQIRRCDMLFIAFKSGRQIEQLLRRVSGYPLLTVSDTASFARQGGVVGLITVGDRIEIQINLEASRRANLKISSRLLNLATLVEPAREGGR